MKRVISPPGVHGLCSSCSSTNLLLDCVADSYDIGVHSIWLFLASSATSCCVILVLQVDQYPKLTPQSMSEQVGQEEQRQATG